MSFLFLAQQKNLNENFHGVMVVKRKNTITWISQQKYVANNTFG